MCTQEQFKWFEVAQKWQEISENPTPAFPLNTVFGFMGKKRILSFSDTCIQ